MRFALTPFRRDLALSVLGYLLIACLLTWPVVGQLSTAVAGEANRDNLQFVWNLWWIQEALITQQHSPANVTMLHWPDGGSNQLLALSVLIPALALPTTLLAGPVVSYNLWFLLAFPLAGLSGWLLTVYVTSDRRAAWIGGLVFAFFPHKTMQATNHFLQAMVFLFPLYTIALLRLLRHPSLRQAWVAALTLALSLLVNLVHIGFFLLPLSALLLLHHLWRERAWWRGPGPRWLLAMVALALLVASPILAPFLASGLAGRLDHYQQPGTVSLSADLLAYLTPAPDHPLLQEPAFQSWSAFLRRGNPEENVAYLGLTVLILAGLSVWRTRRVAAPWLLIAGIMLVLALGPFLKVGGTLIGAGSGPEIDGVQSRLLLPYAALMQLPFYEWGRIPNRQVMLAMMALAVLAGLGVASLQTRPRAARAIAVLATFLILLESLVAWPYPTGSAALAAEPVWGDLRHEARGAVLSLPQWDFFSFPPSNEALLAQTVHGQPIVGGYIHRLPPGSAATAKAIQELIVPPAPLDIVPRPVGDEALTALRALGIATILLHRDARSGTLWTDAEDEAAAVTLDAWAGPPRWASPRFALYDLPDTSPAPSSTLWTLDARWHTVEGDDQSARRWMPNEAEAWLWLPTPRRTVVMLDAQSFRIPRTLTLSVDGHEVWRGTISDRTRIETAPLEFSQGHHALTLTLIEGCERPTDLDPASGDGRCLGLLVHQLTLREE